MDPNLPNPELNQEQVQNQNNSVFSKLPERKFLIAAGVISFLLLSLIGFSIFSPRTKPENQTVSRVTPSPSLQSQKEAKIVQYPKVYFETYENKASFPQVPPSLQKYNLKSEFSVQDAIALGNKFGLTESSTKNNLITISAPKDSINSGTMLYDITSGIYSFRSYGNIVLPSSSASLTENVKNYLIQEGLADSAIYCPATFQRKDREADVVYVECHRDWEKFGLPIINPYGLLNLDDNIPMSALAPGKVPEKGALDPNINNVSTGEDGKKRPNDFNTITLGIKAGTTVQTVTSNLRQITDSSNINQNDLLTPQEALDKFLDHKASSSLVNLSGQGIVNLSKVYPKDEARAKKAEISDYVLVYIEKPQTEKQKVLVPMYIIRGRAKLNSGYYVNFAEIFPALKSGEVAGVSTLLAAKSDSLNLGTFSPTPTNTPIPTRKPTPTRIPTQYTPEARPTYPPSDPIDPGSQSCVFYPFEKTVQIGNFTFGKRGEDWYLETATKNINQAELANALSQLAVQVKASGDSSLDFLSDKEAINRSASAMIDAIPFTRFDEGCNAYIMVPEVEAYSCRPSVSDFDYVTQIDGVYMGYLSAEKAESMGEFGGWFYIPSSSASFTAEQLENSLAATPSSGEINQAKVYADLGTEGCPIRVAPGSPTLFIYAPKNSIFKIQSGAKLSYYDPIIFNNIWNVKILGENDLLVNDFYRPYIYYEYQKVNFDKPKEGWAINKKDIGKLMDKLSLALELTGLEKERLIFELNYALLDVESNTVFIGIIPQKEVDQKLPLLISPKPELIIRLHFYVSKPFGEVKAPKLLPIQRKPSVVLELGAGSGN